MHQRAYIKGTRFLSNRLGDPEWPVSNDVEAEKLHAKIGRLTMENDFLDWYSRREDGVSRCSERGA